MGVVREREGPASTGEADMHRGEHEGAGDGLPPVLTLAALRALYATGDPTPADVAGRVADRMAASTDPAVFITPVPREGLIAAARALMERHPAPNSLPLWSMPFAVKDNIDVAGLAGRARARRWPSRPDWRPSRSAPTQQPPAGSLPPSTTSSASSRRRGCSPPPASFRPAAAGARPLRKTRTEADYRLYVLPGMEPAKPGLVRDPGIEIEIWTLTPAAFGRFVAEFLCEAYAVADAPEITPYGGWRPYRAAAGT